MTILREMSIRHRLYALVALAVVATLSVAALAHRNAGQARQAALALQQTADAVRDAMMADMMHDAIRADVMGAADAQEKGQAVGLKEARADAARHMDTLQKSLAAAHIDTLPPAALAALAATRPDAERYLAAARAALAQPDQAAAQATFAKAFASLETSMGAAGDAIEAAAGTLRTRTDAQLAQGQHLTWAVIAASLGLLLGLGAVTVRAILRPLDRMQQAVHELNAENGNLSRRLPPAQAELHEVTEVFNSFLDKVSGLVGGVQSVARQISTTSDEIATGNMDLSQRTEKTSASLQQAAASVSQIASTVQQSSESAHHAREYATEVTGVAARGGEVVSQVVVTMEEIHQSARKISEITGVIDGIAFQTNILALNAAVEAARAGEQGRGFAVVAAEVRSLAKRSGEAAKEIKTLIDTSVAKAEAGSTLVGHARQAMDEIVASVDRIHGMIEDITQVTTSQSEGILMVNGFMTEIEHATQQNTALVEETASVAQEMSSQAAHLSRTVNVFQVG
ncbi:HAMP domain-containing protein [Ideonella sp. B7]|uniref:methyl-accepting chemotaxis protein n=1 Tax=Ideonella benzenivorans TaxID=2831643 RepID=UPI001CEC055E|nr:methyl-accepting chemotaxis protein [Ideonella benzenivorans]MCA6218657.1 HAMP domain-containing protein [Ideonella benzenivorans]